MTILQMSIILLIFLTTICSAISTPPSKSDKTTNHLKFQYGYEIAGPSGGQVREEQRDGMYALGRYYVLGGDSNQKVEYLADNWGFHPYVEYSHIGPHSKTSTQIAHGEEAVKALHNSRSNNKNIFDNIKLQPTTLKLHRVPFDGSTRMQQAKKTSKPLVVVPSPHRPKEPNQIQSQSSRYHPPKQPLVPKPFILEPPSNQIPVYFIQSGYSNPQQQQNYLHPPNTLPFQTTILVPVKNAQPEFTSTYPQPAQMYFNGIQPSALPLIYEPPLPEAVLPLEVPPPQQVVLENIQDNIKNQLLQEQDLERQRIEQLYGNKINAKLRVPSGTDAKLIESTRALVTAQDVININESLDDKQVAEVVVPTSPSTYYVTTVHPPKAPKLSENPIVVHDPSENNIIVPEQYQSTTQQTVNVNGISAGTILVTPRPQLGNNHLAPINAAIQLQTVENHEAQVFHPTVPPSKKQNVIVEIQKSVPYYLGKFEFVQDASKANNLSPADGTKYKYDISAETAENFELGKTILSTFGSTPAVGSTTEPFQDNANNLDQHQEGGQVQYHVVPAQNLVRDRAINKPPPTVLVPLMEPAYNYGPTETTPCDHMNSAVTYLSKVVPDSVSGQQLLTNDIFPTSKPLGTIREAYYKPQRVQSPPTYHTIDLQGSATGDSFGLVPPVAHQVAVPFFRPQAVVRGVYQVAGHQYGAPKKYRHARQSFAGNLRIEYGFMPPLIPSVEIDVHGKPIENRDI